MLQEALNYLQHIDSLELIGVLFGFLAVYWLIKENILTWPAGIIYCIITIYIFWQAKLYQDFGLTIFFLIMNIYGWVSWFHPINSKQKLRISLTDKTTWLAIVVFSIVYVLTTGYFFKKFTDASLPYADATTTGLSIIAMWMTARKKIENWFLWLIVDVLAMVVYFIKGLDFYGILYFSYIFMAVAGYLNWRKLYKRQLTNL